MRQLSRDTKCLSPELVRARYLSDRWLLRGIGKNMSSFVVALELVVSHPQPRFVERSRFPELSIICKQLIIYRLARVRHNYIDNNASIPERDRTRVVSVVKTSSWLKCIDLCVSSNRKSQSDSPFVKYTTLCWKMSRWNERGRQKLKRWNCWQVGEECKSVF